MTITYTPEDGALDVPSRDPRSEPIQLNPALQAQFNALTSYDAYDAAVLALRRAIADQMHIPWINIHIEGSGVKRRDIQRGEEMMLPPDLRARLEEFNQRLAALQNSVSKLEWEHLRNQVAQFIGLPVSLVVPSRGSAGFYFQRSLVPNEGEIENGKALVIPDGLRPRVIEAVRNMRVSSPTREAVEAFARIVDEIAHEHHLPVGRVQLELNPIRCVYREFTVGERLPIPYFFVEAIQRANRQAIGYRYFLLSGIEEEIAQYFGLEPNQVIMFYPPNGGDVEVRRAPQPPPNGPRQSHLAPNPPPVPPIIPPGEGGGGGGHPPNGPNPPLPPPTDDSLSTGAIVGIVSGSIIGLILIIFVIFFIRKRRDQSKRAINAPARPSA